MREWAERFVSIPGHIPELQRWIYSGRNPRNLDDVPSEVGRTEPVDLRVGTWRQAFSNQIALEVGAIDDSNLAAKQQSRISSTHNSF